MSKLKSVHLDLYNQPLLDIVQRKFVICPVQYEAKLSHVINAAKNTADLLPDGSEPGSMLAHLFHHFSQDICTNKPSTCACACWLPLTVKHLPIHSFQRRHCVSGPRLQVISLIKKIEARRERVRLKPPLKFEMTRLPIPHPLTVKTDGKK